MISRVWRARSVVGGARQCLGQLILGVGAADERAEATISWKEGAVPAWRMESRRWSMRDGRSKGPLWRTRKVMSHEAVYVTMEIKRIARSDPDRMPHFLKVHVSRLLKIDLIAVHMELQRQNNVALAFTIFEVIKKEPWYKPDMYFYKDMILVLAKNRRMDEVMTLWKEMRAENLEPDMDTYAWVLLGFLRIGSPMDAMVVYEEMKQSPNPPEEHPYRVMMKGLFPHPLLRNKVKKDYMDIFPDRHVYDPPEEIFSAPRRFHADHDDGSTDLLLRSFRNQGDQPQQLQLAATTSAQHNPGGDLPTK